MTSLPSEHRSVVDDPLLIGGTIISNLMAASKWIKSANNAPVWRERDLMVDRKWLKLAIKQGLLNGSEQDYIYANQSSVSSLELERKAEVMFAVNKHKQVKYRITVGTPRRLGVLMRKVEPFDFAADGA